MILSKPFRLLNSVVLATLSTIMRLKLDTDETGRSSFGPNVRTPVTERC